MAKRLDPKALKGAFARGKTKRNLDFLVPTKPSQPEVENETSKEAQAELTRSGPQRRKETAAKRTAAKRRASKRRHATAGRSSQVQAKVLKKAVPKAKPVTPAELASTAAPRPAVTEPAPSPRSERIVHEVQAAEAELGRTALYDGWAPAAPVVRPSRLSRWRGRLGRVCDRLIGSAARRVLRRAVH